MNTHLSTKWHDVSSRGSNSTGWLRHFHTFLYLMRVICRNYFLTKSRVSFRSVLPHADPQNTQTRKVSSASEECWKLCSKNKMSANCAASTNSFNLPLLPVLSAVVCLFQSCCCPEACVSLTLQAGTHTHPVRVWNEQWTCCCQSVWFFDSLTAWCCLSLVCLSVWPKCLGCSVPTTAGAVCASVCVF